MCRSRTYEKILHGTGAGIQSSGQLEDAMAELAGVGTGPASLSHELFGDFARQAQPQGMVGATTGQQLPTGSRPAPPISALTQFPEFDNFAPAVLGECPYQPPQGKKKRGARTAALADCTGQLKVAREEGIAKGQQLLSEFTGKACLSKILVKDYAKSDDVIPESIKGCCELYDMMITQLHALIKGISSWNLRTAPASYSLIQTLGQRLSTTYGAINVHRMEWTEQRRNERKEKSWPARPRPKYSSWRRCRTRPARPSSSCSGRTTRIASRGGGPWPVKFGSILRMARSMCSTQRFPR